MSGDIARNFCAETTLNAVSAYSTLVAALVAAVALAVAARTLREAARARRVTLAITLSERYSNVEMHKALTYLGRRRDEFGGNMDAMANAYIAEVGASGQGVLHDWNVHRRTVSKFFIAARALCEEKLLDEASLARQLQKAAFEMCVNVVGVLDEAHSRGVLKRADFDTRTGDYFRSFLYRHFP